MEILYVITAVLLMCHPESSAEAADIACAAMKNVVVRSLFPMMVLSRLIAPSAIMRRMTAFLRRTVLWKRLNISDALLPCVITGLISGLPSGARGVGVLVREGRVTPKEASKAVVLSSLPSPAFVILVAAPTPFLGLVYFLLLLTVAYFTALLFKSEKSIGAGESERIGITRAIADSASSAVLVAANITFFTAVICLVSSFVPCFKRLFAIAFEMGSGVIFAGENELLVALALGWRGFSAFSQIKGEARAVPLTPYIVSAVISTAVLGTVQIFLYFL